MLAKHLLFLATRRPHNALLTIPGESIPAQAILQPPPAYILPPKPQDRTKPDIHLIENFERQKLLARNQIPIVNYAGYNHQLHQRYPHHFYYDGQNPSYEKIQNNDDERDCYPRIEKKQQFFQNARDTSHQFFTLPTRRSQKEVEGGPRSATPDITRGLGRGPLSAMHMLARHGQKPASENYGHGFLGREGHGDARKVQNVPQNRQISLDLKNRFASPSSPSALGYRLFASSPVHETGVKCVGTENLQQAPFSPISSENGFRTSTPTGKSNPSVAERLANPGSKCASLPNSGRSTPTNLILSPTKSTMTNDELFAAIHKSKRRLNIKDDTENLSPSGSLNSLVKIQQVGTRHSWSPESHKVPEIPPTISSPSTTSRMDFKRLLLQQSVKSGPLKLSAAEQLKMSRQHCQQLQQHTAPTPQTNPLAKVLSPRSAWRFQTPRTDVLSSTIIEDTAAEEKAMKPSPENPSPISRIDRKSVENVEKSKNEEIGETPKSVMAACENRRRNVQLARAQFLATPVNHNQNGFFNKRFRARSESPQHAITQKVPRSPSAPTLETAL